MDVCLAGYNFSEKTSSKELHSHPPAAADKLDVLLPPPDDAAIAEGGKTIIAESLKNNLAEDRIEVLDSHEAAQTEGKYNISIALIDTVTSFFLVELFH